MDHDLIPSLQFLNHAGFKIESSISTLIIDPWLEGSAFNESWSLLDNATSNSAVIADLNDRKMVNIWISHEHSDHFSTKFARDLAESGFKARYLYQKTNDKRVVNFIRNLGFEVLEVGDGEIIQLDSRLKITTWSFYGDSYCLINAEDVSILNLNDCAIDDFYFMKEVKDNLRELIETPSLLLTQFGYANWIGNEDQSDLRRIASAKMLERFKYQIENLQPKFVIPFASFSYFSHFENSYMNCEQNSPLKVRNSMTLEKEQGKIFFLKPGDLLDLNSNDLGASLHFLSKPAEDHWLSLSNRDLNLFTNLGSATCESILKASNDYLNKCNSEFYALPFALSYLRMIPAIRLHVSDLDTDIVLRYHKKAKFVESKQDSDMSLSSEMVLFLLDKDFGFDTLSVSARFRCRSDKDINKVRLFFSIQYFVKDKLNQQGIFTVIRKFSMFPTSKIKKLLKIRLRAKK